MENKECYFLYNGECLKEAYMEYSKEQVGAALTWADQAGDAVPEYPVVVLAAEVRRLRAERDELRAALEKIGDFPTWGPY